MEDGAMRRPEHSENLSMTLVWSLATGCCKPLPISTVFMRNQ